MQNELKKPNKRQKRTHMSGQKLKQLRREMKFAPRDMCEILQLKRRTYQDYEAGKRGIPAGLAARIRELHQRDREFIAGIGDRVETIERGEEP